MSCATRCKIYIFPVDNISVLYRCYWRINILFNMVHPQVMFIPAEKKNDAYLRAYMNIILVIKSKHLISEYLSSHLDPIHTNKVREPTTCTQYKQYNGNDF